MAAKNILRLVTDVYVDSIDIKDANLAAQKLKDHTQGVVTSLVYKGEEHVDIQWHWHVSGDCDDCESNRWDEYCDEVADE